MTRRARVELNPVVYAFDAMAPIISLGQVSRWEPDPGYGRRVLWRRTGGLLRWYYWLHIGAGWMLTTLLVIAMTGVLREV